MSELKDAFDDLAAAAPAPAVDAPAPDLWRRGVRRKRRRQGVAALAALAVVGTGVTVALAVPSTQHADAPVANVPESALTMPDRLYETSAWLPGTDDVGPPGPIAALFNPSRGRGSLLGGGDAIAYVAVSAVDGSYRFLDVEGLGQTQAFGVALSPDGRRLAFPTPRSDGSTNGTTIYDAVTGRVTRVPGTDPQARLRLARPVWTPDSRTLLTLACPLPQGADVTTDLAGCDGPAATTARDVVTGRQQSLPASWYRNLVGRAGTGDDGDDLLAVRSGHRLARLQVSGVGAAQETLGTVDPAGLQGLQVGSGPRELALVEGTGSARVAAMVGGRDVRVGDTVTSGEIASVLSAPLDGSAPHVRNEPVRGELLGLWRPGWPVTVRTGPGDGSAVTAYDAAGSQSRDLVRLPAEFAGSNLQVAWDRLAGPYSHGHLPDSPRDPRVVPALVVGGLLVAGLLALLGRAGLGLVRRRRSVTA